VLKHACFWALAPCLKSSAISVVFSGALNLQPAGDLREIDYSEAAGVKEASFIENLNAEAIKRRCMPNSSERWQLLAVNG